MNHLIEAFARNWLMVETEKLTSDQQGIFCKMYGHLQPTLSIKGVIVVMPTDKLDWAMQQVERTILKNAKP